MCHRPFFVETRQFVSATRPVLAAGERIGGVELAWGDDEDDFPRWAAALHGAGESHPNGRERGHGAGRGKREHYSIAFVCTTVRRNCAVLYSTLLYGTVLYSVPYSVVS